ncbi:MAG: hypothetical protein HRT77_07405 [Halioglobus sp.]|nr:hypothetical protein [Halioglobus sp.]
MKSSPARLAQKAIACLGQARGEIVDVIDLLRDPAYRHVLLNHIPIIGLFMAFLVLVVGIAVRQHVLVLTGLALATLTAGSTFLVVEYGDAAYPKIYDILDGHGRDWLDYHAELAETWVPLLYATTVLALAAFVIGVAKPTTLRWASPIVTIITLAAVLGAAVVAHSGGKIQHPEFRLSDPP